MPATDTPLIYLITPPAIELSVFPSRLDDVLDAHEVSCVRMGLASQDETYVARAADELRAVCHAADVALVIDTHVEMAQRIGLDGVHLTDGARSVRKVRAELGADAIVGAYCATSRHDGMNAGEAGADYVSFGPVAASALGDGTVAEDELFAWWSEVIELPVVAEGQLTAERIRALTPVVDFFAIGEEIWREEDAAQALATLKAAMA